MIAKRVTPLVLILLTGVVSVSTVGTAIASTPVPLPPTVGILLTDGELIDALAAEPAPFDMVRITMPSGTYRYLAPVRIRAVFDESGEDRTRTLLDEHETVGTPLPPAPSRRKRDLRVGPRSVTRSFLITETSLLGRVRSGGPNRRHDLHGHFDFDMGMMSNVGENTAVGGTVFVGTTDEGSHAGARLRLRRWISRTASIDVAPGIIALEHPIDGGDPRPPGFSLQLSVSPSRYVSLTTEVFTVRRRDYLYDGIWARSSEDIRDTGVMAGVRIGQWPGAVAGAAATLSALFASSIQVVH